MSLQKQLEIVRAAAAKMPDEQLSHEVLTWVKQGAPYDELFFSKLSDPSWLPILDTQNYFSNIPGGQSDLKGRTVYRPYLPLLPLQQLAPTNPKEVTQVLIRLKVPENPVVEDQILRAMAATRDRSCIPALRTLAVELSKRRNRSTGIFINELLKAWVGCGAFDEAMAVARAHLIATVDTDVDAPGSDTWMLREVNRDVFEALSSQCPLEMVRILFDSLRIWVKQQRARQKSEFPEEFAAAFGADPTEERDDYSYWLEDFRQVPDGYRDLEITLATRLFDAAEGVYRLNDRNKIAELDQLLRSDPSELFSRLRWQVYADFPEQSLAEARRDVLARIPELSRADREHKFEFAQLLLAHANAHGDRFLSMEEVVTLFDSVFSGPVDVNGDLMDAGYQKKFRRKQLQPIRGLLRGEQLAAYESLAPGTKEIDLDDYKPFRSGGGAFEVVPVAPEEAAALASKPLSQVWTLMNEWQPKADWRMYETHVEENYDELATRFAQIVQEQPERFQPVDKWWQNLRRPEALHKLLEHAVSRLGKNPNEELKASPTSIDWANWFGVAEWVACQRPILRSHEDEPVAEIRSSDSDWTWSRITVARFLEAAIRAEPGLPEGYWPRINSLIRDLVEAEDPRLKNKEGAELDDWLTTAINSVRGRGMEVLLELALKQKKIVHRIEPWMFELICNRLDDPTESPAIFALVGAKLRLVLYLFGPEFKGSRDRLFPQEYPKKRAAAVVAHFTYDHPLTAILEIYPRLPMVALDIFEAELKKQEERKHRSRDFALQLGTHMAFYYWNEAFENEAEGESTLSRFFAIAPKETRARLISNIGSIFQKENESTPKLAPRVMRIWERRLAVIAQALTSSPAAAQEYEEELAQFTDWLRCECFPFSWRFDQTMKAITLLPQAPRSHYLLESIIEIAKCPGRLTNALEILSTLLSKASDELRWSIEPKGLAPTVLLGLESMDANTRLKAQEVQDKLLRLGFFDFLDVGK